MTDINVSQDTENGISLLLKICEIIMHRIEILSGERILTNNETMENFDEALVETSGILFRFLEDFENQYGGGFINMGASKALKEISEGNLSDFYLKSLFINYQTIVNKFVLLDAHRSGQTDLEQANEIYKQFSDPKRRVS